MKNVGIFPIAYLGKILLSVKFGPIVRIFKKMLDILYNYVLVSILF